MLSNLLRNLPDVTKNLLIINVLMYIALMTIPWVNENLALYNVGADGFKPYQLLTHMFMHSSYSIAHILMNMFGLVMFGSTVEKQIGAKKFLILYFVSGVGALALQLGLNYYEFASYFQGYSPAQMEAAKEGAYSIIGQQGRFSSDWVVFYNYNFTTMVGASGAIMGVLAAFAYFNPNTELMLIFLPIPVKAKYFIPFFMILELTLGVGNFEWDNIAHWAHLGGAIAGFILVLIWRKDRNSFY